ncbi:hypothetical protein NECAME_17644 [Necator americanus]|uniref:Porin domain-containing protein n=1 Tax=Necator americanus TaxID=51031 RepID=W2TKV9_NECAM|nr:hypothetical protein NECAME_17644 [Necator americanus]ETN82740.1 hypothetical protein NECAME_17644 [Necator americanus]
MKKITISCAAGSILAVAASPAFAQSSVTLYGLVDAAVRYQTNAAPDGKDLVGMTVGPETNSRWGLRGTEDLGGGLSAIFRLENQFDAFNGKLSSPNELFGRQSYVGLSSDTYGTLTLGRQYSPLYDSMAYAASKVALRSYARTWTMELKDRGIRVNTITPGPCGTPLIDAQESTPEAAAATRAKHAANIPLGRMARPEEIAGAMFFLASEDNSFVAGSELLVDGGMCSV